MGWLAAMALKNMFRYRRRTILTASAVAVGIGMYIFLHGWLLGAEQESERNIIWYETSSGRIMHPEYWKDRDLLPLSFVIKNPEEIIDLLAAEGVPAAPRTVFSAELVVWQDPFDEDGSMPVRVFAVDPDRDDDVFRFRETVEEGRYLEPGDEGILMGRWLADDLGARVGYPVALVTRTREGYFQTVDAEIIGIINCPNPYLNRSSIFMDLDTADFLLQMGGAVTEIDLSFPLHADADRRTAGVAETLQSAGYDLDVKSWHDLARDWGALIEAERAGTNLILLLMFIIAAVGITNTMLMAVYERTREVGMLRAIGMKDQEVRLLFMLEAAGIGFLGGVIGLALGAAGNLFMVNVGLDFSWWVRDMDIGYRTAGVMYGAWNPGTMILSFFLGIFICFGVAFIPTRRALRMKITDCLRH